MRRASLYNTFSASLLLVCNACLSSCVSQIPLTKEKPVNNSTYQVEYLFEHEGCKVYRFMDMGHYIYFTNCKGDVTSIESASIVAILPASEEWSANLQTPSSMIIREPSSGFTSLAA